MSTAQSQIADLQHDLDTANEKYESTEKERARQKDKKKNVKANLKEKEEENTRLQNFINDLEGNLDSLKCDLEQAHEESRPPSQPTEWVENDAKTHPMQESVRRAVIDDIDELVGSIAESNPEADMVPEGLKTLPGSKEPL